MINGKKGDGMVPAADTSKNSGIPARVWAALTFVCLANVVGHLAVLPSLPAQIPVHWGADGAVNGWGPSWTVAALGQMFSLKKQGETDQKKIRRYLIDVVIAVAGMVILGIAAFSIT